MIKKIFSHQTDNVKIQLFRSLFVGGFAFVIDFVIFAVLTEIIGIYYLIANIFAFIAGLISNYLLSIKWVFTTHNVENRFKEFILFALIGLVGLFFNQLILWICTDIFTVYVLLSKVVATLFTFIWNFFARRYFIERLKEKKLNYPAMKLSININAITQITSWL